MAQEFELREDMALVFSDGFGGQGCVVAVIEVRFVEDPDLNARGFNEVSGSTERRTK